MSVIDYVAVAADLDEAEGKLLAAASAAGNARMALGADGAEAADLTRALDAALVELRCLQAQYTC